MSLEALWDLQAKASPRSLAVYPALSHRTNPFSSSDPNAVTTSEVIALVYGTDRGSLHYRTYSLLNSASNTTSTSTPQQQSSYRRGTAATSTSGTPAVQPPLGMRMGKQSASSSAAATQTPRHYLPMDLGSLPGPVIACVPIHSKRQQTFVLFLDDGRGNSNSSNVGDYATLLVASSLSTPGFQVLSQQWGRSNVLPRMSCAYCYNNESIVYGAGRNIQTLSPDLYETATTSKTSSTSKSKSSSNNIQFNQINVLPVPGVRSGQDAMIVTAKGKVAVAAVGNSFYAVPGRQIDDTSTTTQTSPIKILTFPQSTQVHPAIVIDLHDQSLESDSWSSLFLASGRECAVVDLYAAFDTASYTNEMILQAGIPRNGTTVTVTSPILSAAASWPWVAVLQSDGLISIRSPSCLAIALKTVEVGQRPNDFFVLRSVGNSVQSIVAASYSGECKVLQCQPDSAQDLADRLMRHSIDAMGANGFPRTELAEAVNASFTATSYTGPEPSLPAKTLLKQYLEAVLDLSEFESGAKANWLTESDVQQQQHGTFAEAVDQRGSLTVNRSSKTDLMSSPSLLLTSTAILCLVCSQLQPPQSVLARKAAKSCTEKMGIVFANELPTATNQVCELVAERLLREASAKFSLGTGSSPTPITPVNRTSQAAMVTDFVEAAIWLLRACGKHERAIDVAYERLQQGDGSNINNSAAVRGLFWSQIKYESYTATHLSEIWSAGKEEGCQLVLTSPATHRLLEKNPRLGLSVFTAMHPQNEAQWRATIARDDPLAQPERVTKVLRLLKGVHPTVSCDKDKSHDDALPLESGRAVAIAFLRSAIGISSSRPPDDEEFDTLPMDSDFEEYIANFHDELSLLLLEGVIAERPEDEGRGRDTELGKVYRSMLRELLKWPLAKIRTEQFMESLPPSFLQEKALVLGRLGRHDDALRILYRDLKSLELALEYCDDRYSRQKAQQDKIRARQQQQQSAVYGESDQTQEVYAVKDEDNAYLPLVRVALESEDSERGTATAIKVLALRRGAIDRAAALRLLPSQVPVSAVARPFLIPALVDSESQVRRMTVVSALLRSRYLRLKEELTTAQLKAQANIYVVPALKSLNLGDPLHSTKSFRARTTSATPGSTMPYVEILKHFFPRHLVIQAKVTNAPYSSSMTSSSAALYASDKLNTHQSVLSDIAFVVAESSEEEAIQPMLQVPIQLLPPKTTGSAWCVLSANPVNMDSPTAQLTCELRYSVQSVDSISAAIPASVGGITTVARTFVEELQDLEVHSSHFSYSAGKM